MLIKILPLSNDVKQMFEGHTIVSRLHELSGHGDTQTWFSLTMLGEEVLTILSFHRKT